MDIETPGKTLWIMLWSLLHVEFMFSTLHLALSHRTAGSDVMSVQYQRDGILANRDSMKHFFVCLVAWYIINLSGRHC